MSQLPTAKRVFFGWWVTGGAFALAVFGWGLGFYGPPVFLSVLQHERGWSPALVSAAITVHYLIGAAISARLPVLHVRFGAAPVTQIGVIFLALGVFGWSIAAAPWQLFVATLFSGAGWGSTSSSALNAIITPWFNRARPTALGLAYNGASVGGVIFSPLWVAAIHFLGFPMAASAIGVATVVTVCVIAQMLFAKSPGHMGLQPDGDAQGAASTDLTSPLAKPLPGALLWRDWKFQTLAVGIALALFAQLGLFTHLFSLLVPALGAQRAGFLMAIATVLSIAGRTVMGWAVQRGGDRRLFAVANYGVQLVGSIALLAAGGTNVYLLVLGVVLFGVGVGNTTSLPPLIAQVEFVKSEVIRVVALIVSMAQAAYAFAPAIFGLIREIAPGGAAGTAPGVFITAALLQGLAIVAILVGRNVARRQ
jgi:MFS family permease